MSITNYLNKIKTAVYGRDVRGAIHDAIKECYDDASVNHDNANMEVKMARGTHNTLNDRLDKYEQKLDETNAQLSADFSNILTKFNQTKIFKGFTAHRGFNGLAPENTLKSISKAIELGFVVCEIDIQKTKDGQWVLMHDYTVDATTNGSGNVKEMTLEEIKKLKVDVPTQLIDNEEVISVPTFEEVVKLCAKHQVGLNIDGGDPLKFSFTEENVNYVVDMLDKYNLTAKSWIICKTKSDREFVHNLKPHMRVGWVSEPSNVNDDIIEAKNYKLNAIVGYNSNTVTEDVVTKCQKNGVELLLFGANTNEVAYKSINMGVSYIETDKIIPGGVM